MKPLAHLTNSKIFIKYFISTIYQQPVGIRYLSKMAVVKINPRLAVCQFTATENKEENLKICRSMIEKAASLGAKVVFLPEANDYIASSIATSVAMAEPLDGPTMKQYKALAKDKDVWLSLGIHQKIENDSQRIYNSHVLVNNEGQIASVYNKVHLFDLDLKGRASLMESSYTKPGTEIKEPIETPVEMSIALRQQGAEILTFPSAFTQPTGQAHWEVLLRSRAIENQCYVVAAAQTGKHNDKRSSYGHAMIVDPWGTIISQCREGTDVCLAEIDLDYLNRLREQMPVQTHKRLDLYPSINAFITGAIDSRESYEFGQYKVKCTQVFYKSGLSYAFVNIKPVLRGHLLIAPLRKVPRLSDLTNEETADLFNVTRRVSDVCLKHFGGTALTVAVQDGADAGQTVEHVHVHVLPRKPGDFESNDTIYTELQNHDKDLKSKLRTENQMEKEAAELRPYFVL